MLNLSLRYSLFMMPAFQVFFIKREISQTAQNPENV